MASPGATPIATGTRPSRRASKAMTRSRRAGQTNRPSRSNGATSTSPTASAASSWRSTSVADRRRAPGRAADPEQRDVEPLPQVEDRPDAGVRDERASRGGVVDEPGRHQPARPARRAPRRRGGTARAPGRSTSSRRTAARRSRRPGVAVSSRASAVAETDAPSPMPTIVPVRTASRRTSAASRPTIRRVRSSGPAIVGARWTASRPKRPRSASAAGLSTAVRVDDPDLDDALGPGPLEQPRHLRPGHAEQLGDRVLRLAELVVQAARADELLEVAHARRSGRCTFVL